MSEKKYTVEKENNRTELQDVLQALVDGGALDISKIKKLDYHLHYSNEFASIDIEAITQDNRAINALHRAQVFTLGELIEKWDTLDKLRNVGKRTVGVVRNSFMNYYYCSLGTPEKKALFLKEIVDMNTIGEVEVG